VPVLMYHVINPPIAGAPYPALYVTKSLFSAQMRALKAAGWQAVTMDQLEAYWTRGVPLPPGKPIVLTFDNGYVSQYTNALPVLRKLGMGSTGILFQSPDRGAIDVPPGVNLVLCEDGFGAPGATGAG